jgi:hypothetical protein
MFTVEQVKQSIGQNALIEDVDTVPKGHIRIATGFLYPDGSSIDVFIEKPKTTTAPQSPKLTDFGGTWSWLQNLEMRPNKSPVQKLHFNRIMEVYGCQLKGAAIELELASLTDLPVGIIRLGQACLRTADMIYTKRLRLQNSFNQDVEEIISEIAANYEPGVLIPLRTGAAIKIDFRVRGQRVETAVQTLASGNSQYAHQRAVEINARWDDLRELSEWANQGNQCLTVFDDSSNVYDLQDIRRLERKSVVLPISDTETLTSVLRAA